MAQNLIGVYNLALSAAGVTQTVDSPSENSPQAEQCRLWFEPVRDLILQAAFWPCAKGVKRLGVLAERDPDEDWLASDPLPGWRFAYGAPSDMLRPRYMTDFARFTTGIWTTKRAIFTDVETPVFVYTVRQTDISLWDASLYMAVSYGLASHMALALSGKPNRAALAVEQANALINQARVIAANEEEDQLETIPDWLAGRGYSGQIAATRYFYPHGPALTVSGAPLG